jgi:hypothetical protein
MPVGRAVVWKKNTVDSAYALDIARLANKIDFGSAIWSTVSWSRDGVQNAIIDLWVYPPSQLRLLYTVAKHVRRKVNYDYVVELDTTPCHFGGNRWWFLCPNAKCRRRCRILYMAPGSDYFLCRICQNLTYRSQQEGPDPFKKLLHRYYLEALSKMSRGRNR